MSKGKGSDPSHTLVRYPPCNRAASALIVDLFGRVVSKLLQAEYAGPNYILIKLTRYYVVYYDMPTAPKLQTLSRPTLPGSLLAPYAYTA